MDELIAGVGVDRRQDIQGLLVEKVPDPLDRAVHLADVPRGVEGHFRPLHLVGVNVPVDVHRRPCVRVARLPVADRHHQHLAAFERLANALHGGKRRIGFDDALHDLCQLFRVVVAVPGHFDLGIVGSSHGFQGARGELLFDLCLCRPEQEKDESKQSKGGSEMSFHGGRHDRDPSLAQIDPLRGTAAGRAFRRQDDG